MPKKEALERFHKESIAAAADTLFSGRGMDKTTMDDIAREAHYSKATLYTYFKSKDEIFYYNVLDGMKLLHARLQSTLKKEADTRTTYLDICNELAKFCEEKPLYFHSMLETIASDAQSRTETPVLNDIFQMGEALNDDVDILVKRGIEQGFFDADFPSLPTGSVHWAALSGIVSFAIQKQDYIYQRMGMRKEDFLQFGFQMMFHSIAKEIGDGS
ncbi:MAG: TetR/AcrR family transcriptional regulator [Oscillospiraceae bacterium]|nr:TetR/AcrR family transcriptional regulator [Oscillospiraceae bacterium]